MTSSPQPALGNSLYLTEEWRKHAWNRETVTWLLSRHNWAQIQGFLDTWDRQLMDGALYVSPDAAITSPPPYFILNLLHAWAYDGKMREDGWAENLLESEDWIELTVFIDSAARDGSSGRSAVARNIVRAFKHVLYASAPLTEARFRTAAPSALQPSQSTVEDLMRFYKNPSMPQSILRAGVEALVEEVTATHASGKGWALNSSKSGLGLLLAHATAMEQSTFSVFGKFLLKKSKENLGPKDPGVRQLLMQVAEFPASRSSGVHHQYKQAVKNDQANFAISGYRFWFHTYDTSRLSCGPSSCTWKKKDEAAMKSWFLQLEETFFQWKIGLSDETRGPFFCANDPRVAKHRASSVEAWLSLRTGGGAEAQEPLKDADLYILPFMGVRLEGIYDALGDAADDVPAAWLEELLG